MPSGSDISTQAKTVLIVDDDPLVTQTMQHLLKRMELASLSASQWAEAMDLLERESPDLILLDMRMPNVDGPTLLEFIRESGHEIPVVVVSASLNEVDLERLRELGVKRFVPKPFSAEELRGIIEEQLQLSQPKKPQTEVSDEDQYDDGSKKSVAVSSSQQVLGRRWKPKAGVRRERTRHFWMVAGLCAVLSLVALGARLIITGTDLVGSIKQSLKSQSEVDH